MAALTRHRVRVLELDLDRCANTYGIAPCTASGAAGAECYNKFPACQDKPNFTPSTETLGFVSAGAPVPAGESIRPYLIDVATAAVEIDIESGLARRGSVTVTLADPPDSDIGADPYHATRATPAQGSYWTRLLARNRNYAGRFARLKTAYFTAGWDAGQFVTELYVIDRIAGPDGNGQVRVTLKDPSVLTTRATVPVATDGALASPITALSASLPLGAGHGAQYPAAGFVRIGDEVIEYTGKSADTLTGAIRAQFGTVAEAAGAGDAVQLCRVWQGVRVYQVLDDLLAESGIPAGNIDSAGFLAEDDQWLGADFAVTAVLSEPEDADALLGDLLTQIGGFMWWDPVGQKMKFMVNAPLSPGETAAALDETAHFIENTVKIEALEALRITRLVMYYDPISATADLGKATSFARGRLHIDADAESANEYGDVRASVAYSRWFTAANDAAVLAMVSRRVGYYRNAPRGIDAALDVKDESVEIADLADVTLAQLVDDAGAPLPTRCLVLRRRDADRRLELKLRSTSHGVRVAFFAPGGAGDYPADADYAHFAPDAAGFPVDGSGPYVFF